MKTQPKRELYIPKESDQVKNIKKVEVGNIDAEIYTYQAQSYTTGNTFLYAIAFCGKAQKPTWHYRFDNEEQRQRRIGATIESRKQHHIRKSMQKLERSQPHNFQVGDILSASWGYDQTNVNFYQVTRVVSDCTIELDEISGVFQDDGYMCGHCTPIKNSFKGKPMIKRVSYGKRVTINSVISASKWDGKPERYSYYA
jgi:hypothetical protein